MAATSTLKDDFQWGDLDTNKWDTSFSSDAGQIVLSSLYCHIAHTAASQYNSIYAATTYDLTGSNYYVNLIDAGNQALTSHEAILGLYKDGDNKVWFNVSGGNLSVFKKVAGAQAQVGSSTAYSSTNHAWLRIREASGTLHFDTSADGSSWSADFQTLANPFAITAIKPYLESGCWQAEASASYADFGSFNVQPGELQFSWKNYTWNKRIDYGNSMYNGLWSTDNVTGPDGSDYMTLHLTNAGSSPVGGEFYSEQRGFGYGTYITTIGTRTDNLDPEVVMGGMFTFDFTRPPEYAEIDIGEVRRWDGNPNTRILYSHTWNNAGVNTFITDHTDVTADVVQTHTAVWSPTKIEFTSYIGEGTSGTVLNNYTHYTHIPTTSLERIHFNLWVADESTPDDATPCTAVIRNFQFIPMGSRFVTDYDRSGVTRTTATSRNSISSRTAI